MLAEMKKATIEKAEKHPTFRTPIASEYGRDFMDDLAAYELEPPMTRNDQIGA